MSYSYYIATKPLQIMIADLMRQFNPVGIGVLLIVDAFTDAEYVSDQLRASGRWGDVHLFPSTREAYKGLGKAKRVDHLYTNSDIGLRVCFENIMFRVAHQSAAIHVYEEGVGSYIYEVYSNRLVRNLLSFFGVGVFYGGAALTKDIHLFDPQRYTDIRGAKVKVNKLEVSLYEYICENREWLEQVFFRAGEVLNIEGTTVNLLMSGWEPEREIRAIENIPNVGNAPLLIKPHPHIKRPLKFEKKNIISLPARAPVELILLNLSERFERINVYHFGSSTTDYFDDPKVGYVNLYPQKLRHDN